MFVNLYKSNIDHSSIQDVYNTYLEDPTDDNYKLSVSALLPLARAHSRLVCRDENDIDDLYSESVLVISQIVKDRKLISKIANYIDVTLKKRVTLKSSGLNAEIVDEQIIHSRLESHSACELRLFFNSLKDEAYHVAKELIRFSGNLGSECQYVLYCLDKGSPIRKSLISDPIKVINHAKIALRRAYYIVRDKYGMMSIRYIDTHTSAYEQNEQGQFGDRYFGPDDGD